GIGQVNQAVSNLDQMTQQNAALVEESSAAALAMNDQAQRLADVVAVFNVGAGTTAPRAVPQPSAPAMKAPVPVVAKASAAPAPAKPAPSAAPKAAVAQGAEDEWESF
ncbi:methyl-accepting chemotaxis protein, partial [Comamonas aquatica]|nr:methyl-accepting chemotaxis protein [Comamonas aquatica]MDH1616703.1 methyl-accepting chemotaxis protein [Comamonas aquatica]MDH2004463.1 methyl-accepting chemotaxis protein [Comamonas aquatica]